MASERDDLLKLLFSDGLPAYLEYNPHVNNYLAKVGNFKVEDLQKEPARLKEEKATILEQTQELALSNYKTFIQTAECSRELFKQFNAIEGKVNNMLVALPKFEVTCHAFAEESSDINKERKLNSLTLVRNAQLLEILELPQLMDSFIKDGLYEDSLELAAYVRRLYNKHTDIPIFKSILDDVEKSWTIMLRELLEQLRQELSLPKCLQIMSHLRQMEVFTEAELRLKFLQSRNSWLSNCLKNIPSEDATHHLNKTIEITRVNLFNIVTQYRAVFNDDDQSALASSKGENVNRYLIFLGWIRDKIQDFLKTVETDLSRGITTIDSILGQCMYFGLSFSRIGCDFRPLIAPIFTKHISASFERHILKATKNLERNMERFTLINKNYSSLPWKAKGDDPNQPPESLLEFNPLAEYLNNILTAFNELRLCPPVACVGSVVDNLQESLTAAARSVLALYTQEHQAFTPISKEAFVRLCVCFADDLVPFVQKCVHIIFPLNIIAAHAGVTVQTLQKKGICFLDKDAIVDPIKHLLPAKIEPILNELEVEKSLESAAEIPVNS